MKCQLILLPERTPRLLWVRIFLLLKLLCSNQPRKMPADRIRNINNAPDMDRVQNNKFISTIPAFWKINMTVKLARIMLVISFAFMSILLSLRLFFYSFPDASHIGHQVFIGKTR